MLTIPVHNLQHWRSWWDQQLCIRFSCAYDLAVYNAAHRWHIVCKQWTNRFCDLVKMYSNSIRLESTDLLFLYLLPVKLQLISAVFLVAFYSTAKHQKGYYSLLATATWFHTVNPNYHFAYFPYSFRDHQQGFLSYILWPSVIFTFKYNYWSQSVET